MSVKTAPNSAEARDVAYLLHPAINARRHQETGPLVIESGQGIYVTDTAGKPLHRGPRRVVERGGGLWRGAPHRCGRSSDAALVLLPFVRPQVERAGDRPG